MPAGPGTLRRHAGGKSFNGFGLVAAAILTAGLASIIVFKGDLRQARHAAPAQPTAAQVSVPGPLAKAPPPLSHSPAPVQPPSEQPSLGTPGSPVEAAAPAADSFSSPTPFFSSEEEAAVPRTAALQPYEKSSEPGMQPAQARPVLPAANRLIPRLQPGGQTAAVPRAAGALAALPAAGPCTNCKSAVSGTKTNATLQGGESYVQHEVSTVYTGVCEGKYVYEYTNLTANKTIGMKVVTSGGEVWTFTLKPGEKTALKSATEFSGGNAENIRLSEVMN
jgi:hypothetical protein